MNIYSIAKLIREDVLAGDIVADEKVESDGTKRVSVSGKTYDYKHYLKSKLHMSWDGDGKCWYTEIKDGWFWPNDRKRAVMDGKARACLDHIVAGDTYAWE